MSVLVSVSEFRQWSGAASATVPDELVQACLDEAEAGITLDADTDIALIQGNPSALDLATGEELRRASRLLARRNSPEAVSGVGDTVFQVPVRDPDSYRTISAIRAALVVHEAIA